MTSMEASYTAWWSASDVSTAHTDDKSDFRSVSDHDPDDTVNWHGPFDPANPINWPESRKWIVAGAALLCTLVVPWNGTSITVAAQEINRDFGISDAVFPNSYWPVTSWTLGGTFFIIVLLPLMEDVGVRFGFLAVYAFFVIMIIPQALAQTFATLIVSRFFAGGCVNLLANTLASVIPDLWAKDEQRSLPVSLYIVAYLMGSTLAPPVFAGVMQHIGDWRWIFYIQLIIYVALFPIFYLLVKETRGAVILRRRAAHIRHTTKKAIYPADQLNDHTTPFWHRLYKSSTRPLYLVATEPVLLASTLWSAFSFGTVYLFTQSVGQVFSSVYGWAEYSTGYVQIAVVIGELLGFFAQRYSTKLWRQSAQNNFEAPGIPIPEARLYVSAFASFGGIVGGMFVYAWTSYPSIPWIAPAIGLGMVGFGIQLVISAVADYVMDAYAASGYAGSAVSAVAAGETLFSAFLPLAAQSMYTDLGIQWASTLLAFLALLLSLAPVLFIWKGRWFREKSPFMRSGRQLA